MALKRIVKPQEYIFLPDGAAVRNIGTHNIQVIILTPQEVIDQKIENNTKKAQNETSSSN